MCRKSMDEEINELDIVEVVARSAFTPEAKVGEIGTVVAIHNTPGAAEAFEIECVLPNGETKWQGAFMVGQIKRIHKR